MNSITLLGNCKPFFTESVNEKDDQERFIKKKKRLVQGNTH